jgi:hypothetical protein
VTEFDRLDRRRQQLLQEIRATAVALLHDYNVGGEHRDWLFRRLDEELTAHDAVAQQQAALLRQER